MGSEMTNGTEGISSEPGELDEERRAAIFGAANAPRDRHGALQDRRVTIRASSSRGDRRRSSFSGSVAKWPALLRDLRQGEAPPKTHVLKGTPTTNPHLPTLISPGVHRTEGYWRRSGPHVHVAHPARAQVAPRVAQGSGHRPRLLRTPSATTSAGARREIQLASHELGAEGSTVAFRDRQH